jgi:hypothetical protein
MSILSTVTLPSSGSSVSVPSGAKAALFFWNFWHASAGNGFSSATLGAASFSTVTQVQTASSLAAIGLAKADVSALSGSQTFTYAFTTTPTEGPTGYIVFLDDIDYTTFIYDYDAQAVGSTTVAHAYVNGHPRYLVLGYDAHHDTAEAIPSLPTYWGNIATHGAVDQGSRLRIALRPWGVVDVASQDSNVSSVLAVSIQLQSRLGNESAKSNASDQFNRANNASLGANWADIDTSGGQGAPEILSNVVTGQTVSTPSAARYTAITFPNDQVAECIVAGLAFNGSNYNAGPIVRASSDQDANRDYYMFRVEDDASGSQARTLRIGKYVNGTWTSIASTTSYLTRNGMRLRLVVRGTNLYGLLNGQPVITTTDASLASGQPGVSVCDLLTVDNFKAWGLGMLPMGAIFHGDDANLYGSELDHDERPNTFENTMGVPTYSQTARYTGLALGWEANGSSSLATRRRETTYDPRLLGEWFTSNDGSLPVYRIDMPSSGQKRVRIAGGDPHYDAFIKGELLDGSTIAAAISRGVIVNGNNIGGTSGSGGTGNASFLDATNTLRQQHNWQHNNVHATAYFGSGIFRYKIGDATNFNAMAYLSVEDEPNALQRYDLLNATASTGVASSSFTPPPNSVIFVEVWTMRNGNSTPYTPGSLTFADSGGKTWTRRVYDAQTVDYGNSLGIWTANSGASPASMTVTVTKTAGDVDYMRMRVRVYAYVYCNAIAPIGGSITNNAGATDGAQTLTLGATPAATSEILTIITGVIQGANDVIAVEDTNFIELVRNSESSVFDYQVGARGNTTSTTAGWSDTKGPSSTDNWNSAPLLVAFEVQQSPTGVVISDLSTFSPRNGSSLTITLINAGATQGTGTVTIGGVSQSVTSWADTSITITVARGTLKFGTQALVVTNGSSQVSNSVDLTLLPISGWDYVNLSTPNATSSYRLTATADLASGDQVSWDTKTSRVEVYSCCNPSNR